MASGSVLRLAVNTPAVQRVLSITGVDRVMEVFPGVAASLAGPFGQPDQVQPDSAIATADADGGA